MAVKFIVIKNEDTLEEQIKQNEKPCFVFSIAEPQTFFFLQSDGNRKDYKLNDEIKTELKAKLNLQKAFDEINAGNATRKAKPLTVKLLDKINKITGPDEFKYTLYQGDVIDSLNVYLKDQGLDIEANKNGICNGLAAVFCKYQLEDREDEFFANLLKMANRKTSNSREEDSKLDQFAAEVLYAYSPHAFNKSRNQVHAVEEVFIANPDQANEKKNLQKAFEFAGCITKEQWEKLINDLRVEGATYTIASTSHIVGMSYRGGIFYLYDPNFSEGIKSFEDTKNLLNIIEKVFNTEKDKDINVGGTHLKFHIKVIENPYKPLQHSFPDVSQLFKELYEDADANIINEAFDLTVNKDDLEFANLFINKKRDIISPVTYYRGIYTSIAYNYDKMTDLLLKNTTELTEKQYFSLFECALSQGSENTFNILQEHLRETNHIVTFDGAATEMFLRAAAQSGNAASIVQAKTLCLPLEDGIPLEIIEKSVEVGNVKALEKFLEITPIPDDKIIYMFEIAIKNNQRDMLHFLFRNYPEENITENLYITTNADTNNIILEITKPNKDEPTQLEKTEIDLNDTSPLILRYLKDNNVVIDASAIEFVDAKIKNTKTFQDPPKDTSALQRFLTFIKPFTDWIKESRVGQFLSYRPRYMVISAPLKPAPALDSEDDQEQRSDNQMGPN